MSSFGIPSVSSLARFRRRLPDFPNLMRNFRETDLRGFSYGSAISSASSDGISSIGSEDSRSSWEGSFYFRDINLAPQIHLHEEPVIAHSQPRISESDVTGEPDTRQQQSSQQ